MEDWLLRSETKFKYMLLDRLRQDCEYYLRIGGSAQCLWADTEKEQIQTMIDIWNYFPEGDKPEWLTMEQIKEFAQKMGVELMKGESTMVSNILIWHEQTGFIQINEGSGDNLLPEDEENGYVDYIMLDFLEYNGIEFVEKDGAQVMLTELYQEKFKDKTEVVKHLIDSNFIPELEYVYLYAK